MLFFNKSLQVLQHGLKMKSEKVIAILINCAITICLMVDFFVLTSVD